MIATPADIFSSNFVMAFERPTWPAALSRGRVACATRDKGELKKLRNHQSCITIWCDAVCRTDGVSVIKGLEREAIRDALEYVIVLITEPASNAVDAEKNDFTYSRSRDPWMRDSNDTRPELVCDSIEDDVDVDVVDDDDLAGLP